MTLDDFEGGLDRYGVDLADWPDGVAAMARALLADSAEARALVETRLRFERLFAAPTPPPAPSVDAILRVATARPRRRGDALSQRWLRWIGAEAPLGLGWRPAAALATYLAVGLLTGFLTGSLSGEASPRLPVLTAATLNFVDGSALDRAGVLDD